MLFWTRHANFRPVENYIYDPSARIFKNPLNFTIFWTRHLNSATRQLNSTKSAQLGNASNFTLKCNSIFRRWISQLGDASTYLDDASTQLGDASKMQLWPQWLTTRHDTSDVVTGGGRGGDAG